MAVVEQVAYILGYSYIVLVIGVSLRVIVKRRPPGVSLAWLILVVVFPYGGAIIYLLMGERTLGRKRARRAEALLPPMQQWLRIQRLQFTVETSLLLARRPMQLPRQYRQRNDWSDVELEIVSTQGGIGRYDEEKKS